MKTRTEDPVLSASNMVIQGLNSLFLALKLEKGGQEPMLQPLEAGSSAHFIASKETETQYCNHRIQDSANDSRSKERGCTLEPAEQGTAWLAPPLQPTEILRTRKC